MMVRAGSGWQTVLADLSLILFMVTAATLSQAGDKPAAAVARSATPRTPSPQSEPLAVWRDGSGAPPLANWLESQSPDPRAQLTILAPYMPGRQAEALSAADRLARAAGEAGRAARIVIEPGSGAATATLAYDVPAATLARGLQGNAPKQPEISR